MANDIDFNAELASTHGVNAMLNMTAPKPQPENRFEDINEYGLKNIPGTNNFIPKGMFVHYFGVNAMVASY